MNCLIKKSRFIRKTDTFHINMFLILLIFHLINVFFDFPGAYSRKYTVLLKKYFLIVT